mgnify:CR=1 FL=1
MAMGDDGAGNATARVNVDIRRGAIEAAGAKFQPAEFLVRPRQGLAGHQHGHFRILQNMNGWPAKNRLAQPAPGITALNQQIAIKL